MQGQPIGPLIPPVTTAPATNTRTNKQAFLVVSGVVAVVGFGVMLYAMSGRKQIIPGTREQVIPETTVTESPAAPPADLRMTTSYVGRAIPKAKAEAAVPPAGEALPNADPPTPLTQPPARGSSGGGDKPPPSRGTTPTTPSPRQGTPTTQTGKAPEGPRRWYTPKDVGAQGDTLPEPFKRERPAEGQEKAKGSQLFPKAVWEIPRDPTKVIYEGQPIQGILMEDVVTGEDSTVRIKVTETLYDRFGQQRELLPMDTTIMGTADGSVKRGQNRIKMKVRKAQLPNGVDLLLVGKVADQGGAVGVPGKVDNKIGQTIFATVITTALGIVPRIAAGNTTGFQPTLEQQMAAEFAQSVNSTGRDIVKRSLDVEPTIFVKGKTPVVIQLSENVSLQTQPVMIDK